MPQSWFEQNSPKQGSWFAANAPSSASMPAAKMQPTTPTDAPVSPHPLLAGALEGLSDFTKGIGKGALNTVGGAVNGLNWGAQKIGLPPVTTPEMQAHAAQLAQTHNTTQAIGKGAEQVGEFFLPGAAEEAGIAKLGGGALARLGVKAAASGAVNKLQGGSFATGAVAGGAGEGLAQGLKKVAPDLAEISMRMRGKDRGFGAEPGRAILDETTGLTPSSVAQSGQARVNSLGIDKQALLANAPDVNLDPARQVGTDFLNKANAQGHVPTYNRIAETANQLNTEPSGNVIPQIVPATRAGQLQRGLGEATAWDPSKTSDTATAAGRALYGRLGQSIEDVAPEVQPLNERIHSLLPVVERAKATDLMAGLSERMAHKLGVHTGAMAGTLAGFHFGGIPGAAAGFLAPELLASPTTYLAAGRAANSPAMSRLAIPAARAAALQYFRPKDDE